MTFQLVSGVKVWGDPDDGALAQANRCSEVGDVAGVCLMADHHLGYSQPIGGVVAYRNTVSPSGVGYDIACFVGDQAVALADGRSLSFTELIAEQERGIQHFGFSLDSDFNVVIGELLNVRKTGDRRELLKITLDNGEAINCTPEHVFYNRFGAEIEASSLAANDSLAPLYLKLYRDVEVEDRSYSNKRMKLEDYLSVLNPSTNLWDLVHRLADDFNISHGLDLVSNGPIRHHADFNKLNNAPPNVRRRGWKEHFTIQSEAASARSAAGEIGFGRAHKLHPEFFSKMGSENMRKLHRRSDFKERRDVRASQQMAVLQASEACKHNWAESGKRGRLGLIAYNKSEEGRRKGTLARQGNCTCKRCKQTFPSHSEVIKHYHRDHKGVLNHSVVSVERIIRAEPVPVFCLEVPAHHNFALSAGVFVHNCGNKAVRTNIKVSDVKGNIKPLMDDIFRTLSFGVGRKNATPVDHELFDDPTWVDVPQLAALKRLAQDQLGTVGSGNHFVDLFEEAAFGDLWVGCHLGSRGFGHKTASGFLNLAAGRGFSDKAPGESVNQDPTLLSLHSELGQAYMAAMTLAGRYAYAGRDYVVNQVLGILGAQATFEAHNHHNYAWDEEHNSERLVVVRKGATPCWPGQVGFIGGSMGDISVIVKGKDTAESKDAFRSTVHGAGRIMSRTQAAGKMNWKTRTRSGGKISPGQMCEAVKAFGVELRGAGTDESPFVYRQLQGVLDAHSDIMEVMHVLKPIGVAMAGGNEFDPYKD